MGKLSNGEMVWGRVILVLFLTIAWPMSVMGAPCAETGPTQDCDGDGNNNDTDDDDDNDGICDGETTVLGECVGVTGGDLDPFDPNVCVDSDFDSCDDCALGNDGFGPLSDYDTDRDGPDGNGDGECDRDVDGDGVADVDDPDPNDPFICGDVQYEDGIRDLSNPIAPDGDGCDDCTNTGADGSGGDRLNDGVDSDSDGLCDKGDPDADYDGDSLISANDHCPTGDSGWTSDAMTDHDGDGCRDSSEDTDDDNDGITDSSDECPKGLLSWDSSSTTDHDSDGCQDSSEDDDDDNDGVNDSADACPKGDTDWTSSSATDNDMDGCNDATEDPDDDNDGVVDSTDQYPLDRTQCGDLNGDGTDNCAPVTSSGGCSVGVPSLVITLLLALAVMTHRRKAYGS